MAHLHKLQDFVLILKVHTILTYGGIKMCSLQGILDASGGVNECVMILRLHILLHLIHKSQFEVCIGVYLCSQTLWKYWNKILYEFPTVMWSFHKKFCCLTRRDQQKIWSVLLHYFGSNHFKASSSKLRPHTGYYLNIMYHKITATCSLRW